MTLFLWCIWITWGILEVVIKTALSETEIELLQGYVASPVELIRLKALTILGRNRRIPAAILSEMFNRSERVITRWVSEYRKHKISSIFSGKVDNQNAAKLTKEQKEEIKAVVGQPPNEQGLPKEFWDVPKLKNYVSARFGVVYESDVSYHFLLRFSGLSLKYPDKLSPRRNEKAIIKRIKEIRKEIKPMRKDPSWVILTADETRLQEEAEIRRAWLFKGKRTIVKTERSKEHQNYLGFLDQKTGECTIYPIKRGNQVETLIVLRQLMKKYSDKKVCVIWDNARWHKGKIIKAELAKQTTFKNLHLISTPPYAPDYNPIEHVWAYAKNQISNRHSTNFKATKTEFETTISERTFNYRI